MDHWTPSPWLLTDPDEEGKEIFLEALRKRYTSMIIAWRRLLDMKGTNCVSFKEFEECCRRLKLVDRAPGIWRAFDEDASGSITLGEIDPPSHNILEQFKIWAESTFGTIHRTFRVLDSESRNALSLAEFKQALRDVG